MLRGGQQRYAYQTIILTVLRYTVGEKNGASVQVKLKVAVARGRKKAVSSQQACCGRPTALRLYFFSEGLRVYSRREERSKCSGETKSGCGTGTKKKGLCRPKHTVDGFFLRTAQRHERVDVIRSEHRGWEYLVPPGSSSLKGAS